MNARQLEKIGIPRFAANTAIQAVQQLAKLPDFDRKSISGRLQKVAEAPRLFLGDPILDSLAKELLADSADPRPPAEPLKYRTWGSLIDAQAFQQMDNACQIPSAVGAALMPDAHVGYGLPIGGVLATEGAIVPYAVGVDIACRMKLSVLDLPVESLDRTFERYRAALENGTRFGVGSEHSKPQHHEVLDRDWTITRITREHFDRARRQLGTSGSGNHFVEFGVLTVNEADPNFSVAPGSYVALLSHSGSRGVGAAVCSTYSAIARQQLPRRYQHLDRLAWLDMDTEAGQEYFAAMNLMGDYAAANHAVIHRLVSHLLGARVIETVENHHNFAWLEQHGGKDVYVHRKGATPAGRGVLGVIPGSMGSPAYVVRGLGNPESLNSASHGAGRVMSRTQAQQTFNFRSVQKSLEARGIRVLSAGADEVPGVYKDIQQVMAEQADLVEPIARFDPRIVKMCGDGSKAED
ncbi:MAG: RNA-splicing ligase RtcB [Planctomycetota bacterium]|jgi:tRNA-splicing ligase RtcB